MGEGEEGEESCENSFKAFTRKVGQERENASH